MQGNKVFSELSGNNALGNLIFGGDAVTFNTFLNLEKYVLKDGSKELAILFKVEANNDLFVRVMEGESLIFLLDDGRLNISTEGSFNTDYDMMDQSSVANARYPITKAQFEQIKNELIKNCINYSPKYFIPYLLSENVKTGMPNKIRFYKFFKSMLYF